MRLRAVAGGAHGLVSPVTAFSDIFYLDAAFAPGARLAMTMDYPERNVLVDGTLEIGGEAYGDGTMIVLDGGEPATLTASGPARATLLGGAPLDGPRHLWWNFVSSSPDRI